MSVKTYKEREAEILRDPARRARIASETAAILAANRLARLREQAGMTQADVARILGVTQSRISRVERAEDLNLDSRALRRRPRRRAPRRRPDRLSGGRANRRRAAGPRVANPARQAWRTWTNLWTGRPPPLGLSTGVFRPPPPPTTPLSQMVVRWRWSAVAGVESRLRSGSGWTGGLGGLTDVGDSSSAAVMVRLEDGRLAH